MNLNNYSSWSLFSKIYFSDDQFFSELFLEEGLESCFAIPNLDWSEPKRGKSQQTRFSLKPADLKLWILNT